MTSPISAQGMPSRSRATRMRPATRGGAVRSREPDAMAASGSTENAAHTRAESAVTVNSTSGEQALWRGLPLKALGDAVFNRPEFCSDQPLDAFFAAPKAPDHEAYLTYRQYLLQTSQVAGGFYSASGRKAALRRLPDMMLAASDPYDTFENSAASARQQIRIVA